MKRNISRGITTAVLMLFSLLLGTAAVWASGEQEGASAESTTITFWKAPHSESEAEYWQPILEEFMSEHPEIKVEHLVTPWNTWVEQYTAAFAGGNPPDVSYMTEWYPRFADTDQLEDLSDRISEEMTDRYGTGAWQYATYNGETIGIPFIALNSVFYYNKEIFEEEGIEIPETWDELRAAAKKATRDTDGDGEIDQWGMTLGMTPSLDIHQFAPFIIQSGASYLNEEQTALGFANPEGIRGVEFVTGLVVQDEVAPPIDMYDSTQSDDLFYQGRVGMRFGQLQFRNEVENNAPDIRLGSFVAPAGPAENPDLARANYGGMGLFSIASASKNKDAAWAFVDFITRPENESMYLSKVGFLSPNEATNDLMYPDDEFMMIASAATQHMVTYPLHSQWQEIDTIIKRMFEEVLRGAKDAEIAVRDANEQAQRVLR